MILVVCSLDSPAAAWVEVIQGGGFSALRRNDLQAALLSLSRTFTSAVVVEWPTTDADPESLLHAIMSSPNSPELCVLVAEEGKDTAAANVARGELVGVSILRKPVAGSELVKLLKEGKNNP